MGKYRKKVKKRVWRNLDWWHWIFLVTSGQFPMTFQRFPVTSEQFPATFDRFSVTFGEVQSVSLLVIFRWLSVVFWWLRLISSATLWWFYCGMPLGPLLIWPPISFVSITNYWNLIIRIYLGSNNLNEIYSNIALFDPNSRTLCRAFLYVFIKLLL